MSTSSRPELPSPLGQPTWEIVDLFPRQGAWREDDFLRLQTNRLAELVDGRLEVLPMPNWLHQLIVVYLMDQLRDFLRRSGRGGQVLMAPLPVLLFPGTIREPDLFYVLPEHLPEDAGGYPRRVDLVVEVVSEGAAAQQRDYVDKLADYARAGVAEYWIVDPQRRQIVRHALAGDHFEPQTYRPGEVAKSRFLSGLEINVHSLLAVAEQRPH